MCTNWSRICFLIHLLWCFSYVVVGCVQLVSGIFFFLSLPILKLGSNVWVGGWNVTVGVLGVVIALIGKWSLQKQRVFLLLAFTILLANMGNLILLEIGEWHILLPEAAKRLVDQGNVKVLVFYARIILRISSIVVIITSFLDLQITFCSMLHHEDIRRKEKAQGQDVLSDTEYVLPRVKSDSDENENASYFSKPNPQSWVFDSQTAETSTTCSGANRFSQASDECLLMDTKQASSEAEFKNISTQNLNVEQPIVVIENTSDYTDRQLHYMTSFSRTPSPVAASDSSSNGSESAREQPIQIHLEKLTEQALYQSRLDSAMSVSLPATERTTLSTRPPSLSAIDQMQHDSLIIELQETLSNKSIKETDYEINQVNVEKIINEATIIDDDGDKMEKTEVISAPNTDDEAQPFEEDGSINSTDKETVIDLKEWDDDIELGSPVREVTEESDDTSFMGECIGVGDVVDLTEMPNMEMETLDETSEENSCVSEEKNIAEQTSENQNGIDNIFDIAEREEDSVVSPTKQDSGSPKTPKSETASEIDNESADTTEGYEALNFKEKETLKSDDNEAEQKKARFAQRTAKADDQDSDDSDEFKDIHPPNIDEEEESSDSDNSAGSKRAKYIPPPPPMDIN